MIYAITALGVLWIVTVLLGVRAVNGIFESSLSQMTEAQQLCHVERLAMIEERDMLLERIQRPEFRPANPSEPSEPPPPPPEMDFGLIGTVVSEAEPGDG